MKAVTSTERYVRVVAGAGSGKTRALSHRFAYLVNELGILPGSILCVTFTNKSANEMRARIRALTGDNDTGYINTFHGFCVSVLQEDAHAVQYPKSFIVLDNGDIDQILQTIYDERGLTLRDMSFSKARDMIEQRKLVTEPEYYEDMISMSLETLKSKYLQARKADDIIFYGYLYQSKICFGLDYNDLIKFVLAIFRQNEEIRLKWQKRLEYIMIDEFQDIDALQYELMDVLQGYHKNLFIVGDPDQTIYTWRGANIRYLMDFDQHYPGTKTIMMTENYRSTPQILDAANSLISKNRHRIPKDLHAMLPSGQPVTAAFAKTAQREAAWIASEISRLQERGVPLSDITILYRAHYVTRAIEDVFVRDQIPYTIYSGTQFYARKEIKDALAYLRMTAYADDLSFARIVNTPRRMIGKRRMEFLSTYAAEHGLSLYQALKENLDSDMFRRTGASAFVSLIEEFSQSSAGRPVSEILSGLLDQSGYEAMLRTEGSQERLDNLAELKQAVLEYELTCGEETTLESFIQHAALFTNADTGDVSGKVKLMTVHAAKGLEFPYVFLAGLNEGIFPSRRVKTLEAMEEERRLAFVALTRAEKGLYLSQASGRNHDGSWRYPSRFLLDIDQSLLEYAEKPSESVLAEAQHHIDILDSRLQVKPEDLEIPIGARVRHALFGEGTVIDTDSDRQAHIIQFDGMETPRAISYRAKLKLLEPAKA
ncbi:MAG: UvrD-helicase domain-containing protein [Clostridia bacterium]|nr:UvrD-helicase domain-containing protein [Clostridia bacterium]